MPSRAERSLAISILRSSLQCRSAAVQQGTDRDAVALLRRSRRRLGRANDRFVGPRPDDFSVADEFRLWAATEDLQAMIQANPVVLAERNREVLSVVPNVRDDAFDVRRRRGFRQVVHL